METFIPKTFKKYFWDTDINKLDKEKNSSFIIERLLELGDINELNWLNNSYSKKRITTVIKNSRRISSKTGNFFSLYYNIPKESIVCMKTHYTQKH